MFFAKVQMAIFRFLMTGIALLSASTPSFAEDATINFSWNGVPGCTTLSRSPAMQIRNFPKEARYVLLELSIGSLTKGGEKIELRSGDIPAGAVTTMGPCIAGKYRWTATFYGPSHQLVGRTFAEKDFP